jgi:molecular chaperone GrpE
VTRKGSPGSGGSGPIDWQGPGAPPAPSGDDAEADRPDPAEAEVVAEPAPSEPGSAEQGDQRPPHGAGDENDGSEPEPGVGAAEGSDDEAPRSVEAERDDYLDRLQRLQAEFENYRKRMTREQAEAISRGSQALAAELLPVLDGCEAAVQQGQTEVEPIGNQLFELLTKAGLERTGAPGDPFDPELHDAVMHEPAEDGQDGSVIAEVLRTGYSWKGRVLRPAMVKVRG